MAMPQMRPTKVEPFLTTTKVEADVTEGYQQVLVTYEGSPSPRELLENCVIQAQAALKGLKSTAVKPKETHDNEEGLQMSAVLVAAEKELKETLQKNDANFQLADFW
jgi:hypothetical protein